MRKPFLIICLTLALTFVVWRVSNPREHQAPVAPLESSAAADARGTAALIGTAPQDSAEREAVQHDESGARSSVAERDVFTRLGIQGIAHDMEGTPLGGVRVTAGEQELAVTTADGRFEAPFGLALMSAGNLRAAKEGWSLLAVQGPERTLDGTSSDARFVLAPYAALRVKVVDADGVPFSGETVSAQVSPAEPYGARDSGWREYDPPRASAKTDANGVAVLTNVAARVRLRISARDVVCELWDALDDHRLEPRERAADDVTLRAVVLEAGETRTARIVLGRRHSLRGRVVEPDGTASPGASVSVLALDEGSERARANVGAVDADTDGRFALDLVARSPLRRALVVAHGKIGEQPARSMFGGRRLPDPLHVAWEIIELAPERRFERELVLALTPMSKVAGRVLDAAGEPVAHASVVLRPRDASPLDDSALAGALLSLQPTQRDVSSDGAEFRFSGVPPGLYDVEASSSVHGIAWSRGVTAGAEHVVVQFGEPRPATVRIDVTCPEPLTQVIVLQARLQSNPGADVGVPRLAPMTEVTGPFGWPAAALGHWYGSHSYAGPLGTAMFSSRPIEGSTATRNIAPGLVWIGAKGRTERGASCFPSGTGLVRIEEGEHVVRITLALAGSVRGRITGAPRDALLAVALATDDGRLVPLDGRRGELETLVDVGAGGAFHIEQVPACELELRVGHPSELLRSAGSHGGALVRRRVTVVPGETLELDVVL